MPKAAAATFPYPHRTVAQTTRACSDCGGPVSRASKGKCVACRYPPARRAAMSEMRREGKSYAQIAAAFGVTRAAAHWSCRKAADGVVTKMRESSPRRDREEAEQGSRALLEGYHRYWLKHVAQVVA